MQNVKHIKTFEIKAKDGEMGTVHDLFFDDKHWTTRYVVVSTMKWLPGRKVLVSPMFIDHIDSVEETISVPLNKETIKDSPDIDTDQPVSKQHEMDLGRYYGLNPYWSGPSSWGPYKYPAELAQSEMQKENKMEEKDSHLRSVKEVTGYEIEATDGHLGHVEDFIVDEESWAIQNMVVDTKNWWPGKKVLVSPDSIKNVSWNERLVEVELTNE
jgi:sporulation protein YlmC with PRC-barrel domain